MEEEQEEKMTGKEKLKAALNHEEAPVLFDLEV